MIAVKFTAFTAKHNMLSGAQMHRLRNHLQHKHPLKYQHVANGNRQKSSQVRRITNLLSCQSDKPVSDKVSVDLKAAVAMWIAGVQVVRWQLWKMKMLQNILGVNNMRHVLPFFR